MKYWTILFVAALGCAAEEPAVTPRVAEVQVAPASSTSVADGTTPATPDPSAAAAPRSICHGAQAPRQLQRLADCMGSAVGVLAEEPTAGDDLAAFASRALKAPSPGQADYQSRCDWLSTQSLSGVSLSKSDTSWDHFDDGSAAAHFSLVLSCAERGLSAKTSVELQMP